MRPAQAGLTGWSKRTYNRVTRLDGPGGFVTGNRLAALAHRALIGVAVKEQGIILLRRMPSGQTV